MRDDFKIENLNKKYIEFLDKIWDEVDSWSGCVWALREEFGITADYACAVIDAYMEV